jgi:hypothetical protein
MKPIALLAALAATLFVARARTSQTGVAEYAETVGAILAESASDGRAYELLAELCGIAPHRLAGSEGAERAVRWAEARMKAMGFENVHLEPCSVPRWVRGGVEELVLEQPAPVAGAALAVCALGGSVATPPEGVAGEVIEIRSWDELEQRAGEIAGRIVLFNRPMDAALLDTFAAYGGAVDQRSGGASRAARHGALAVLVRSMTTRLDDVPHTGAMHYDPGLPARIPAAAVSTRAAEMLAALIASGQTPRVRLRLACETHPDVPSWNVVGELVGRERPHEVVVVGGHLDAWDVGQGAHDDGSGCCQSLEVVRILKALDLRPRRTIRVVLFMNEENGLRGAEAYRDTHAQELGDHVLALESDRGGFAPRGFTCDASGKSLDVVRSIVALLAPAGADALIPGGGGADVGPLARDGVVTAGLLPVAHAYFDFHHSSRDVLAAVHPRELNVGAGAMAALCYVIADLPERLAPNGR